MQFVPGSIRVPRVVCGVPPGILPHLTQTQNGEGPAHHKADGEAPLAARRTRAFPILNCMVAPGPARRNIPI